MPSFLDPQIEMAHGAGGRASRRLIEGLLLPLLGNPTLDDLGDAALLGAVPGSLALTTDSFVVRPLRFPGGSIGEVAVNGTLNDLAVAGARPHALTVGLVLEAGLASDALRREVEAMARAADALGVPVVAGDTKVVEHGRADGMYITTSGLGVRDPRVAPAPTAVRPGDRVLLSGPIGDHGITVLLARGDLDLEAELRSDTRAVWPLVEALIEGVGSGLRWMRDPTRGGVATALNELAGAAGVGVLLDEATLPLRPPVRGACELLGLDPLHIANEGQFLAVLAPEVADAGLAVLRAAPGGGEAALIGEIAADPVGALLVRTPYGGDRAVAVRVGDPLPRIC